LRDIADLGLRNSVLRVGKDKITLVRNIAYKGFEECAFTGTIWSDEGCQLPIMNVEINIFQD
jgi:hypothetical protein